jgi:hypothetical protein
MALEFLVECDPSDRLCREVADQDPCNPFITVEYVNARRNTGLRPHAVMLRDNGHIVTAGMAYVRKGFLVRSLEIESLPLVVGGDLFWSGLGRFCKETGISQLAVHTAASRRAAIPSLPGEVWRQTRSEFVVELTARDLWKQMRPSHRQRVNRSRKSGVVLRTAEGERAWEDHAVAVTASMERRRTRGEHIALIRQSRFFEALIESGRATLFQAVLEDRALSSALVISADKGAYYFWGGTRSEGMALGASHFLLHEISLRLQADNIEVFNLGGTDLANKGLVEFKRGFGASEIGLQSAGFQFGSRVKRTLGRSIELLRDDPARLFRAVMNRLSPRAAEAARRSV